MSDGDEVVAITVLRRTYPAGMAERADGARRCIVSFRMNGEIRTMAAWDLNGEIEVEFTP